MSKHTKAMRSALTELQLPPHAEILDIVGDADVELAALRAERGELRTMLFRCAPSVKWHMHEASCNQEDELEYDLADINNYIAALSPKGEA